jgi:hypothetical protein
MVPTTENPGLKYYYPTDAPVVHQDVDIVVYGATSGGVVAAVQAARMGKSVALVAFGRHVGGLTAGGLTATDGASDNVQGGITAEFFKMTGWSHFSPGDAEANYRKLLEEAGVPVYYEQRLDREDGVKIEDGRIVTVTMENGSTFAGKMFIDVTYEGDLMAAAGVTHTSGRDPKDLYDEEGAGVDRGRHQRIDPYVEPGNPESGVIPYVLDGMPEAYTGGTGQGDNLLQAYCFRMHLTNKEGKVPYPKPQGYDPADFQFVYRIMKRGTKPRLQLGGDTNNHEIIGHSAGTDFVNGNWILRDGEIVNWAQATYAEREQMFQAHVRYQQGYMYYIAHDLLGKITDDEEVLQRPQEERENIMRFVNSLVEEVNAYGLDPEEFPETGHWPWALYIREARRMVSDKVMTEDHVFGRQVAEDSVGLANYWADSHRVCRYEEDGRVYLEGGLGLPRDVGPWPVSYRAIVPARGEAGNLLVPWCISSSKVAFCSMRMEPCFMVLGQSAATAAALSIDRQVDVQDLDYAVLRERLLADGQILAHE